MLVLSLRSQRSDWLGLVCLGLLKHGLCIPAPRQGPAAHERARGRKFLQGRDYAQFPPPPTRSLLVLHELCRKSTRNLNLLLRYTTLQTGLCSPRICSIFFSSSLSSLFLCVCVWVMWWRMGQSHWRTERGNVTAAQCWSRFSAWQALKAIPLMDEVGGAGWGGG